MQKGFIKFLKPYKIGNRSFSEGEIVSVDDLQLTAKQMGVLINEKAVVPCGTRQGISYGGVVSIR
jgi:hypothetical protein